MDWNWRRRPLFWLALLVGGALFLMRPEFIASDDISHEISEPSSSIYVAGIIVSEVESRESAFGGETVSFVLAADKFWKSAADPGREVSGKIRVTARVSESLQYGDQIALSGELRLPRSLRNPGGFDQRAWLGRQGIRALLDSGKEDRLKILDHNRGNDFLATIFEIKAACIERLYRDYRDRDAAILSALFFGVRTGIEDDIQSLFLKTGTLHLLAVSGFNVGFVIAAVLILLRAFQVHRTIRLALALTAAWGYVCLVGTQSPVFRAGIMASVWLCGEMAGRRADPLNSLGLSALILWMIKPLEIFDPGFQLSYAAVFGIVTAVPHLMPRLKRLPGEILSFKEKGFRETQLLFWTSASAQAATLPVSTAHFYVVTPWSVLANVPAGFLVFVIFMAGAVQMAAAAVSPVVAAYPAWLVHQLLAALLGVLSVFQKLPFSVWVCGKLFLPIAILMALSALFFIVWSKGRPLIRLAGFVLVVAACLGAQEVVRAGDRTFRATFLDVGQGDAIHLRFPDGSNWLVDAGQGRAPDVGRTVLAPYLRHEGVRHLERVVISHPQEDHIGGLESLLEEVRIFAYQDPGEPYKSAHYKQILKQLKRLNIPVQPAKAGDSLKMDGEVHVEFLASGMPPGQKNINDASVLMRVTHPAGSILFTGDAGEAALERLLAAHPVLKADILKVPHHGAKPGPQERLFFQSVSPRWSIISAGERNLFGHPSREALEALEGLPGNQIYRTDRSGSIRASFTPAGIRILDGPGSFA